MTGFLAGALGGCTYLNDRGFTLGDLFAFPEPPESTVLVAPAPPPKYEFGDTFVFEDDGSMVEERVVAIDGPLIVWENSRGKQWTAKADPLLPPVLSDGVSRTFSLNADKIFPLSKGLKFRYVVSERRPGRTAKVRQTQSCEVTAMPLITVRAGSFDTYEIFCRRGGYTETLYYAPKANNVILSIIKTAGGGDKVRELVSYVKGGFAASARTSIIPPAMLPSISQGMAKPAVSASQTQQTQQAPPPSVPAKSDKTGLDDPLAGVSPSLASLIRRMDERIRALEMAGNAEKQEMKTARQNEKAEKEGGNARKSAISGYAVQLGAYGTKARARRAWGGSFALAAAAILSPLNVRFDTYRSAKGAKLVRILVGNYKSRRRAMKLCRRLKERKLDCLVVKIP